MHLRRWPKASKAGRCPTSSSIRRIASPLSRVASSDTELAPLRIRSAASDTDSEDGISLASLAASLALRRSQRIEPADARLDVAHQLADFALDAGDVFGHGVTVAIGMPVSVTGAGLASHDVPLLPAGSRISAAQRVSDGTGSAPSPVPKRYGRSRPKTAAPIAPAEHEGRGNRGRSAGSSPISCFWFRRIPAACPNPDRQKAPAKNRSAFGNSMRITFLAKAAENPARRLLCFLSRKRIVSLRSKGNDSPQR